jgi:hypothetical protein
MKHFLQKTKRRFLMVFALVLTFFFSVSVVYGATGAPSLVRSASDASSDHLTTVGDTDYEVFYFNPNNSVSTTLLAIKSYNGTTISVGPSTWCNIGASVGNTSASHTAGSYGEYTLTSSVRWSRIRADNQANYQVVFQVEGYAGISALYKSAGILFDIKEWDGSGYIATSKVGTQGAAVSSTYIRRESLDPAKRYRITLYGPGTGTTNYDIKAFALELPSAPTVPPLSAPTVVTGPASATNQGFTAQWADVDNEVSYTVRVYKVSDNSLVKTESGIDANSTSKVITGLTANTSYYYKVTAIGDGTTYGDSDPSAASAAIRTINTEKEIISFEVAGVTGTITGTNISVEIPFSSDITKLTPTVTVSDHATYLPIGEQDFTNSVTYTVTAEDATTQDYTVTITKAEISSAADITAFTITGQLSSTIDGANIIVVMPYETDVTKLTPAVTVSPAANYLPIGEQDFTNPVIYTVTAEDETEKDYTVTVNINIPAPTIILASAVGTNVQLVKKDVAITDIVYTLNYSTGATVVGLPEGVDGVYDNGTYTISGIPTTTEYKAYNYTITATSLDGYVGNDVTITGTITVKDPNSKKVAVLYTSLTLPSGANKLSTALALYDVTVYDVATYNTAAYMDNIAASGYDLIILHEAVKSDNLAALRLANYIGQTPILNNKSHMYGKAGWPTGQGNNGTTANTSVTVQELYVTHPIFTGVSITNNVVAMAGSTGIVRWASNSTTTGNLITADLSVIANNSTNTSGNISILEDNRAGGTKKYMLIALAAANEDLTENGLLVIKNACDYLMSSDVFVAPKNTNAKILSMTIGGSAVIIDETAKTGTVDLLEGTDLSSLNVSLTLSTGATLTAPSSLTGVDFTNPVTFTVQAEDETVSPVDYLVTVTANVPTSIPNTELTGKVLVAGSAVIVKGATDAKVKVVSLSGTVLYQGVLSSSEEILPVILKTGVYAVLVDGLATKVLVK